MIQNTEEDRQDPDLKEFIFYEEDSKKEKQNTTTTKNKQQPDKQDN